MFKVKLSFVSVLAAFAALVISGFAASSASATFELTTKLCSGGTNINLCYEEAKTKELFEFKGTEEFELLHEETSDIVLTSTFNGEKVVIDCGLADAEHTVEGKLVEDGLILQPEPLVKNTTLLFHLLFLECVLTGVLGEKCKIPAEKSTTELVGETEEKSDEFIVFKPESGTIFIEIPFEEKAKCPATIKGNHNVTGEVLCFILEPLVDKVEHLLECNPEKGGQEGKLFFAASTNPATFLIDDNVFLLGIKEEDPWSISNEA